MGSLEEPIIGEAEDEDLSPIGNLPAFTEKATDFVIQKRYIFCSIFALGLILTLGTLYLHHKTKWRKTCEAIQNRENIFGDRTKGNPIITRARAKDGFMIQFLAMANMCGEETGIAVTEHEAADSFVATYNYVLKQKDKISEGQ